MVNLITSLDINILLFSYLLIYNLSLILFFWVVMSFTNYKLQSLYKLTYLSYDFNSILTLTVLLMSMAGVPPFIGFFSKLFIITLIVSSSFFLMYSLLFVIFFIGLYFYLQNIRFLHSTNLKSTVTNSVFYEYSVAIFKYTSCVILHIISLGYVYVDDLILIWLWVGN